MSDRAIPSQQLVVTPRTGSTRRSITALRPGSLSPGGVGVDIKHNSYDRYLAKLKGKGPLRREVVSLTNPPTPKSGGKVMKMNIINGCDCNGNKNDDIFYIEPIQEELNNIMFDSTICQIAIPIKCECSPVVKLITDYLSNCPKNEIIYVL
jgi:hypothetical protein